jgi:hypothetical protein
MYDGTVQSCTWHVMGNGKGEGVQGKGRGVRKRVGK